MTFDNQFSRESQKVIEITATCDDMISYGRQHGHPYEMDDE
jgi:hypothetical protein